MEFESENLWNFILEVYNVYKIASFSIFFLHLRRRHASYKQVAFLDNPGPCKKLQLCL